MKKYKIAVLDDYQNVALECADWSVLRDRADIAVFQNHLADPDADIRRRLGAVLEGLTAGDKTASLAFFCGDARCALSLKAAQRARGLGYPNVIWYRGGVSAWKEARLPTLESIQTGQVR